MGYYAIMYPPQRDIESFADRVAAGLDGLSSWCQVMKGLWLVEAVGGADDVRRELAGLFEEKHALLIVAIPLDATCSGRLPQQRSVWVESRFAGREATAHDSEDGEEGANILIVGYRAESARKLRAAEARLKSLAESWWRCSENWVMKTVVGRGEIWSRLSGEIGRRGFGLVLTARRTDDYTGSGDAVRWAKKHLAVPSLPARGGGRREPEAIPAVAPYPCPRGLGDPRGCPLVPPCELKLGDPRGCPRRYGRSGPRFG